ncbi:MAG TPA: right-handed parallel beta-helix repeat-containing protein [Thermoanaerobaculia bacterium]|nr:right-handed parallel beta-helix repeat-containing protein [Thermoanaerobaculia bacterium]
MIRKNRCFATIFALCALLGVSSLASAQTRTWVSGVGNDANPCSRTAPCKTFAGAISKTAAGGVISVLDPGGFGAVTITKAITIEGDGTLASILAAGTNGIVVNAGVGDAVVLRNLLIDGAGTGINGIRFVAGLALFVENCAIDRFTQKGIDFEPTGGSQLFVNNTVITNNNGAVNGGGIFVKPGAAGSATATINNTRVERSLFGLRAEAVSKVSIKGSVFTGNTNQGVIAFSNGSLVQINLDSSLVSLNGSGVRSEGGGALIRISDNTIANNNADGLVIASLGQIVSYTNNNVNGNSPDGNPTSNVAQK